MEALVETCKESATRGMERFLRTFSFVPDEKLNWSPSPDAKTPVQIAAHTALTAGTFAKMMRDGKLPGGDNMAEMKAKNDAAEAALTSRADIEAAFRKNTDEVLAALDSLTPQAIGSTLETPFGWPIPMPFLMNLPGLHAMSHASQIDYLQTCWGDQAMHF